MLTVTSALISWPCSFAAAFSPSVVRKGPNRLTFSRSVSSRNAQCLLGRSGTGPRTIWPVTVKIILGSRTVVSNYREEETRRREPNRGTSFVVALEDGPGSAMNELEQAPVSIEQLAIEVVEDLK